MTLLPNSLQKMLEVLENPVQSPIELPDRIDLCHKALLLVAMDRYPAIWAALHQEIGDSLLGLQEGCKADRIEEAIQHYHQGLKVFSCENFPEAWADTHISMSVAYYNRQMGDKTKNIEEAIFHAEQALEVFTRGVASVRWANAHYVLGAVYIQRLQGDRGDNIEQAIDHSRLALEVIDRMHFPGKWATIYRNLALAYYERIRGIRPSNIEQAISCIQFELEIHTEGAFPLEWGLAQHRLGTFYGNRLVGDIADNIEHAIQHFEAALRIRTREMFPLDWADTQHNLALRYHQRIYGSRAQNIEHAIQLLEASLEARDLNSSPLGWAHTHMSLVSCYADRIVGDKETNLSMAVYHGEQALRFYTKTKHPNEWSIAVGQLASIYLDKQGKEQTKKIDKAIDLMQQALEVLNRHDFPDDWATTHFNLGIAFTRRITDKQSENLKSAIYHYCQGLEVATIERSAIEHLRFQSNLGHLYFDVGRWYEAYKALDNAIDASDIMLEQSSSKLGQQTTVTSTQLIHTQAAFCLLRLGRLGDALVMHEWGKTRILAQMMSRDSVNLAMVPQALTSRLLEARQEVHTLEAEMRLPPHVAARRDDCTLSDLLCGARTKLSQIIIDIQAHSPEFMRSRISLPDILKLIPQSGALVIPLITSQGTAVFVIPNGVTEVTDEHILWLDKFGVDDLNTLLIGTAHESGWRQAYSAFHHSNTRSILETWMATIEHTTGKLWELLMGPVHEQLQILGIQRIVLMPSGSLQLLPLHAAWRIENGHKHYLLDDYEVTYAPSAYVLDISSRRVAEWRSAGALVAGIESYKSLPPLPNAAKEAREIAALFAVQPLLDVMASKDALSKTTSGKAFIHLSCHAFFSQGDNPLASALVLANDEKLTLAEINDGALDLSANRLVTLSACETGVIDVSQAPDEYIGFPAGFLQAGAPAVISSLWTVDDKSTSLLMERFYRNHLEKGMSLAKALREAQLWLRDMTNYENPFYWAAFYFSGA